MDFNFENTLPLSLEFYGLGTISLTTEKAPGKDLTHQQGIAFQFLGSLVKSVVVLIDEDFDLSMACELGNLLASKIAGKLSIQEGWDVGISPPQICTKMMLAPVLRSSASHLSSYVFSFQERLVPVQVILITGDEIHV